MPGHTNAEEDRINQEPIFDANDSYPGIELLILRGREGWFARGGVSRSGGYLLCAASAALARASCDSRRSASARRSRSAACADPKHGHCPIRLLSLLCSARRGQRPWLASDLVVAGLFAPALGIYESRCG